MQSSSRSLNGAMDAADGRFRCLKVEDMDLRPGTAPQHLRASPLKPAWRWATTSALCCSRRPHRRRPRLHLQRRPEGLSYAQAAHKLAYLLAGARRLGRSGVALKDDSEAAREGATGGSICHPAQVEAATGVSGLLSYCIPAQGNAGPPQVFLSTSQLASCSDSAPSKLPQGSLEPRASSPTGGELGHPPPDLPHAVEEVRTLPPHLWGGLGWGLPAALGALSTRLAALRTRASGRGQRQWRDPPALWSHPAKARCRAGPEPDPDCAARDCTDAPGHDGA